jgi:PleD family two-component response regulator
MTNNEKKILIVDDDKMNIIALAHYLKPPYEIIVALDGVSALEMAEKHTPDIILLDIIMPDINGFDVLTKLKKSETTKDIPIIFITGLDTNEIMDRGLALGAVDYITKPFDKAIVKGKIDSYLYQTK